MSTDADATPTQVSVNNQLAATDDAQVEQQIGFQITESVVHEITVYTTGPNDRPERRHEVAKAHLEGNNPRRAQEILGNLLEDGHDTTERAYLYVLSILSGREFTDVTADMSDAIDRATMTAAGHPRDGWCDALDVVNELLRYAHTEFGNGILIQEFTVTLQMFGALSPVQQDEIDRHLELIITGTVHDRLATHRKYQVAAERMSGNRLWRAWKFFEPHPRPPIKWLPPPIHYAATGWREAILSCVAMMLAIAWVLLHSGITVKAGVGLALIAVCDYLAVRCATVWQIHWCYADRIRVNYQPQPCQSGAKFDVRIDKCFQEADSVGLEHLTAGYRGNLKRRLQQQYGDDGIYADEVQWLITWHAERVGQRRIDLPAEPAGAYRATSFRIISVLMWAIGLAVLVALGHVIAFVLAVGSWWGIAGIARVLSAPQVHALLDRDAETLLAEEWGWYYRWNQILADRPTDEEMAHWLALDKAYLKDDALPEFVKPNETIRSVRRLSCRSPGCHRPVG